MGTPDFALPVLSALLDADHDVTGVYTRPDKPAGRGKQPSAPPVKQLALERGLPVYQPPSLKPQDVHRQMAALSPDMIVVGAYGRLIPANILGLPLLGCLNVHPSLLPRYRGPSPVAWAILNGADITGVTIIKLDEGMDSGPIVASRETRIGPEETAGALTARLFEMGASLLVEILPGWGRGHIEARPQDDSQATVTKLLSRGDGKIDWELGAEQIARRVRAYYPWPGTFTHWDGRVLKIIQARVVEPAAFHGQPPGMVVSLPDGGLGIAAGGGVLEVLRLQLEGRKALAATDFIQGYAEFVGSSVAG